MDIKSHLLTESSVSNRINKQQRGGVKQGVEGWGMNKQKQTNIYFQKHH